MTIIYYKKLSFFNIKINFENIPWNFKKDIALTDAYESQRLQKKNTLPFFFKFPRFEIFRSQIKEKKKKKQ